MLPLAYLAFRSSDPQVAARWDEEVFADREIRSSVDADPFDAFVALQRELDDAKRQGRRTKWAGYVSYELNRWIEALPPSREPEPSSISTISFWMIEGVVDVSREMPGPLHASIAGRSLTHEAYVCAARRAVDYIRAGDAFQINLAQSFDVRTSRYAQEVWFHLQQHSPATYGARISADGVDILSNSPELFFRIEPLPDGRRRITTRPIKGTRPRGPGMREALERSEKDRAELAMIVDLERNDLGRICEIGSVRVTEPRVIEEHPTLYHGVATIEGFLRADVTLADVFRAMFPCGSITGCPKVRAMQIIDELEPEPRGPYCGAIGYVDSNGSAEFSVAIRTMTMRDGVARVHVGGGIVADSDPAEEHRETIVKARAMLRALGVSETDIDALDDG